MASNGAAYRYLAYRRRRRNGKGMPRWLMAFVLLGGLLAVGAGVLAGISYGVYQSYADDLVPPDEAIAKLPRGGARILDRDGELLYEFLDDASGLRDPVPVEETSLWLVLATVATEDTSFFDNPGVNYKGLAAAAWDNFWPLGGAPGFLEGRGGSSITQQLVKNVYFTQEERAERSVERKIKETVYALELTKRYEKKQILEWYLNQISYGSVFVGVEAASEGYFGKDAKDLSLAEAATLAGIPSCPSCYDPINNPEGAVRQRNRVLRRMYEEHYIDAGQLWEAAGQPLQVAPHKFPVESPHFVFNAVQPELERLFGEEALRRDGLVVYTSIDLDLQRRAEAILEEWTTTFEGSGGHNGAVVAIDPKTAEIMVYIGSRDYFREDILGQNDMADAVNSPGSAFKPFTYVTAFMNLNWGPGTTILDLPIASKYWDGARPPRNPVAHSGPITVRNALGSSLNIPAIKTILSVGVPEVIQQAKKMGITSLDGRDLGPSMTVGGVDVKLIDMVYGFTAFPNLGVLRGLDTTVPRPPGNRVLDPIAILRVEDRDGNILYPLVDGQPAERPVMKEERVAPAQESYLINDILSDGCAQAITFGGCGALSIPGRPMAIKTGTSEPYEQGGLIGDTWAIGYTPQLVVGTWFGNADNSPMTNISSTSVSWRTTRDFMIEFHEGKPVETFTRPEGLARASACIPSGLRPTPACPFTTPEDWFAHPLAREDDWWTTARIDTRTGKLAGPNTPERYVQERRYLRLPDGLTEFQRDEALAWQYVSGTAAGTPPTEESDESDIPVAITSPAEGANVQGIVEITGRAASAQFESYRLEYRSETLGGDWVLITQSTSPVTEGTLGLLDTRALPGTGLYTLRLVLEDRDLGEVSVEVHVLLIDSGEQPTPEPVTPAPTTEPGGSDRGRPGRGGPGRR